MLHRNAHSLLFLAGIYLLLLLVHGYIYGTNDMVEVLPYALYLRDHTLYPYDFYIQHISAAVPNERYLFSLFLSLFDRLLPLFCLILHAFSSMLLLLGLYRIASIFIESKVVRYAALILLLIPLYGINLGGNELYYNMMVSSLLAKSIAVWSLYYFLEKRYSLSWLLLTPAVLIHPVAAGQLALVFMACRFWNVIFDKAGKVLKKEWLGWGIFIVIGGTWIYLLQRHFATGTISNELLLEIFHFRLPHHYIPSAFPLTSWLILVPIFVLAIFLVGKKKQAARFIAIAMTGMLVYTIAVEGMGSTFFLSSQWFKSTIWLKALAVFIIAGYVDARYFPGLIWFFEKRKGWILALGLIGIVAGLIWPVGPFERVAKDYPWHDPTSAEFEIARLAHQETHRDAVFVAPMRMTGFKYYSKRSLYVDYKSMVHRKDALGDWYARINMIYGITWTGEFRNNYITGDMNYFGLETADVLSWKKHGIEYMVTQSEHELDLPVIADNGTYKIYRIS